VKPLPVIVTGVPPAAVPLVGLSPVTAGATTAVYVNRSAAEVADVPPGVVTVTSTVAVPAGLFAVIVVSLTTIRSVATVEPKSTAVAPVNPVPVIVTGVPPAAVPLVGFKAVTVGAARNVNLSAEDVGEVPSGFVTVTSTVPVPAGLVVVIVVALTT
jgi:hypothetical protein